jgi:hypothetical protein
MPALHLWWCLFELQQVGEKNHCITRMNHWQNKVEIFLLLAKSLFSFIIHGEVYCDDIFLSNGT